MSDQYNVRLGPGVYRVSTIQDPLAESAFKVYTQKKDNGSLSYLTFVDSNNATPAKEFLYTTSGIAYNPISSTFYTTNAVFNNDVLIKNDLVVEGDIITNVPQLSVESRTIDVGLIDGGVGPVNNTTWDLGILFNFNEGGQRKKSGLIWEYTAKRFLFSDNFSVNNTGNIYDAPQITVNTFVPIEIKSLWINNECSSGSKVVIGCESGELRLQNIIIDEGEY